MKLEGVSVKHTPPIVSALNRMKLLLKSEIESLRGDYFRDLFFLVFAKAFYRHLRGMK